jgi:hypothetical protein
MDEIEKEKNEKATSIKFGLKPNIKLLTEEINLP